MKSLLNRLDKEVFILDLKPPLPELILDLSGLAIHQLDSKTLEVEIIKA